VQNAPQANLALSRRESGACETAPLQPVAPAAALRLLKLIIARERPGLVDSTSSKLKNVPTGGKPDATRLGPREWETLQTMRRLPPNEREKVYAVMQALLGPIGRKAGKTRQ